MRALIVAAPLVLGTAALALAAAGDTTLISRADSGAKGDGASRSAAVSGDGRFVAFASSAANLVTGDANGFADIFLRDTQAQTTTLASLRTDGVQPNGNSATPAVSDDGRFVAFASGATNLGSGGVSQIFVRDRQAGTTTLVSRRAGQFGAQGDQSSFDPTISADGRLVAFVSQASLDPVADPEVFDSDVYVRDIVEHTTTLVSRTNGATGAQANATSSIASISPDGRYVVFASQATNLPGDADSTQDNFVRDLVASTTTLVSRATDGTKANSTSIASAISAGGRFVAFSSGASNLVADDSGQDDVFVRDVQAGTTELISRATGAGGAKGNGASGTVDGLAGVSISRDGRFATFVSAASNLHPDDADAIPDVFVRDLQQQTTDLASRATGAGAKGSARSQTPRISGDGRLVAFESQASNLHPDDADAVFDLFMRELGAVPAPPPGGSPPPAGAAPPPANAAPPPPPEQRPALRPVVGKAQLVEPLAGTVLVRRRGARRFIRIGRGTLIRDGSEIDATNGSLLLTVARHDGTTESAVISEGRAIVDQNAAARPKTTLRLSLRLACTRARARRLVAAAAATRKRSKRPRTRRLFTRTNGGNFETRGRYGAAAATGTAWRTLDTCMTTTVEVVEGTVRVTVLRTRRTFSVRAPARRVVRARASRR